MLSARHIQTKRESAHKPNAMVVCAGQAGIAKQAQGHAVNPQDPRQPGFM